MADSTNLGHGKNTKSDGVTPEAQLQLRVKFYLGEELNEGIKD